MTILCWILISSSFLTWMKNDPRRLSDDPKVLREVIAEQDEKIARLERKIEHLTHIFMEQRRMFHGPRSERLIEGQEIFPFYRGTELREESEEEDEDESDSGGGVLVKRRTQKRGRRILPKGLRRETHVHDIPKNIKPCPDCGTPRGEIGKLISEELEYQPAELFVREHQRPKYACKPCMGNVVVAEPPPKVIEKGMAGPGLLAHILYQKYGFHVPCYSQELAFYFRGFEIPRSTQIGWIKECVELLKPIYNAMIVDVLFSRVVFSDDSPVRLIEKGLGKTRQARVWAYVGDLHHRQIVYEFTKTREQKWPQEFLKDFLGILQVDAYRGYNALFKNADKSLAAYCWAHARRKFIAAEKTSPEEAKLALAIIRLLYKIEREIKGRSPYVKKKIRKTKARRVLKRFKAWLDEEIKKCLPKSPLGTAIQYARGLWDGLLTYLYHGEVEIDSNRVERSIRGVKLGLKNYLFFGSEDGGRWGATMYSLIESCKIHRIDPEKYLKDVLVRISTTPMSQINSLMPRNWKPPP